MNEYVGALHMHSVFSDGSGTVEEIAEFAAEAGLDFIALTDHNTLRALKEGYERFYRKTFLLVGCEINDKQNQNHYLAFGLNETVSTRLPAKEYVAKVKEMGGVGFIAHPHEERSSMEEHPPYPWREWDSEDFHGIEIWNHMSEWMENLTEENKYQSFVHPLKTIIAPPEKTLALWDRLNEKRKVVAMGGVDAHAHKVNLLGFFEVEVFPYKVLFKSIRTHILSDEKIKPGDTPEAAAHAKSVILEALKHGRSFVANYYHGNAAGFRFFCEDGRQLYQMGDTVPFSADLRCRVILPGVPARIRLLRNGRLHAETENYDAEFILTKKGAYRVEVFNDGKAWIYSNHIRVGI